MTKVDLITGFLGAGKTTFIKKYAEFLESQGEKVHIIENEFGNFSMDARELRRENREVSELNGGCLCCTGRVAFQNLLLQAADAGYDRILVEPSGIYDVNSFFSLLTTEPVSRYCEIGNVITIVDAMPDEIVSGEALDLMYSQLVYTGCVVLSRTQLRQPAEVDAAVDRLQAILEANGSSRDLKAEHVCLVKPWDQLDAGDFDRISHCGYRLKEYGSVSTDHMSVFSMTLLGGRFDTLPHLESILDELLHTKKYGKIYRIKGNIADLDRNWYELNCAPGSCSIQKANVKRGIFWIIGQDYDEQAIKGLFLPK